MKRMDVELIRPAQEAAHPGHHLRAAFSRPAPEASATEGAKRRTGFIEPRRTGRGPPPDLLQQQDGNTISIKGGTPGTGSSFYDSTPESVHKGEHEGHTR